MSYALNVDTQSLIFRGFDKLFKLWFPDTYPKGDPLAAVIKFAVKLSEEGFPPNLSESELSLLRDFIAQVVDSTKLAWLEYILFPFAGDYTPFISEENRAFGPFVVTKEYADKVDRYKEVFGDIPEEHVKRVEYPYMLSKMHVTGNWIDVSPEVFDNKLTLHTRYQSDLGDLFVVNKTCTTITFMLPSGLQTPALHRFYLKLPASMSVFRSET